MQAAIDGGKHEDRSCMVCWRGAEIYLNNYIFCISPCHWITINFLTCYITILHEIKY